MRFCDKLPKLRKNNNYSQEQLADKLNVSRQAVSKWELGGSYPDMDKMLQMCKILNCNLEDLIDDGVLGEEVKSPDSHKFNINTYIKDFLDFITKSYNMFCSMKLKEKIKFLFEMFCICAVLTIIGIIMYSIIQTVIIRIFGYTKVGWAITNSIMNIFGIAIGIIDLIIALHLFKIRYLDYFITIEDQNVTEKTIEEPIEKKENKYYQEKPKEKIIIRDTKHSAFSFFEILGKFILGILKVAVLMCALPVLALFVCLVVCVVISIYHIQYGILFLWVGSGVIGCIILNYIIIEWAYNFIWSKKQHTKRIFIMGIIGLILIGVGVGLSISVYFNYENVGDFKPEDYIKETTSFKVYDNTIFNYEMYGYECEIDDTVEGIQIEIEYLNSLFFKTSTFYNYGYEEMYIYQNIDFLNGSRLILNDIKNKNIRNYDQIEYMKIVLVTMSQETQEKLKENYTLMEEKKLKENKRMEEQNSKFDYMNEEISIENELVDEEDLSIENSATIRAF